MFRTAFSTVACPDWTLERVVDAAEEFGFDAVELRTFGEGAAHLACDPALTDAAKVRSIFSARGVSIAGLGASTAFDAPYFPPVVGRLLASHNERSIREAKRHVDAARHLGAPLVRVFAFEPAPREPADAATARIVHRLALAADGARNTGVRLVLENGGGYATAESVIALVDAARTPHLGVCYSIASASAAGDDPVAALGALGDRLLAVRIKDLKNGEPCPLGEGDVPCADVVRALVRLGWSGPLIYEWDRMWLPALAPAEHILPGALRTIFGWASGGGGAPDHAGAPSSRRPVAAAR